MNIIFFGEGKIAANAILSVAENRSISHIFTTENFKDPKLKKKPLTEIASSMSIPIDYVDKIDDAFIGKVESLRPDIIVVVSFGFFLPKRLRDVAKFPMINIHPSRLPKFRGAAPIIRAVEAGDKEIGISVMRVVKEMDAGEVFKRGVVEITKKDYSSKIYEMVGKVGGEMVCSVMDAFELGNFNSEKQDELGVTFAPKVEKSELLLDFSLAAGIIINKLRAFDVCGGCYFIYKGKRVKIWQAIEVEEEHNESCGRVDEVRGVIFCGKNAIMPEIVQAEGRAKMDARDFWNGAINQK